MQLKITLPDNSVREYPKGITAMEVAKSISEGLARNVLAAKINGEVRDLNRPIDEDAQLTLLTWNDAEGKSTMWHSSAHLMAEALEFYYPGIKFWVGPPVQNGFYYDVDFGGQAFSADDLKKIEDKMTELAKQANPFERKEMPKLEAVSYFSEKGDQYKLDLLSNLEDGSITFYTQGNFTDLCRGPHIPHTGYIKAIKLTNVAGAYWKNDSSNPMLTRIYGITFPKKTRPPQNRQGDGDFHLRRRCRSGLAFVATQRRRDDRGTGAPGQEDRSHGRLQAREDTPPGQGKHVPHQWTPALLRGQHVPRHGIRRREVLPQGDELSASPQDLQRAQPQLPRPPHPPGGIRNLLPV
jgi:hypothetical protein